MEVKIGVRNAGRELFLESSQTSEQIAAAVSAAVAGGGGGVLELVDSKGRRVFVPTEALAYVETGPSEVRKIGFGTVGGPAATA